MRWDSPIVLVIAGTIAVHTILLVFVDAMIVTHPLAIKPPTPRIELFEVDVEPPPPPKPATPEPVPPEPPVPPVRPPPLARQAVPQVRTQPQPQQPETPQPDTTQPEGGEPTIALPDIPTPGRGIPVPSARGPHPGRGGSGGGSGTGTGSGGGDPPPPPPPVSVATIKTRALPKGDYGYFDAGKEYPAEARQLGIEGAIRVKLVVDAAGKVISASLLNKLGHGLDELAMTRAKKIEFEPARDTDDKPVTSVVVWTFNMTLPK